MIPGSLCEPIKKNKKKFNKIYWLIKYNMIQYIHKIKKGRSKNEEKTKTKKENPRSNKKDITTNNYLDNINGGTVRDGGLYRI